MFFDNYTELNMNLNLKETRRNLFVMISTWPKKYTFVYFPFKCFIIFIAYLIPLDLCILLSFFNVFFYLSPSTLKFWWLVTVIFKFNVVHKSTYRKETIMHGTWLNHETKTLCIMIQNYKVLHLVHFFKCIIVPTFNISSLKQVKLYVLPHWAKFWSPLSPIFQGRSKLYKSCKLNC